jgi:serine/threonine protein phosphatase PrpC
MKPGENRAWFQVEAGAVEAIEFCGGVVTHFSQRCPTRDTTPNEDSACIVQLSQQHGLLAVADGLGGASSGDKAARAAIEGLIENANSMAQVDNPSFRGEILDAIESANQTILSWGTGAGSTLVVVEFANGKLRTFHVGDAKAVLLSNRGRIKYATVGHAPVAMAVEIGVLNEREALNHADLNLISNCLGSREMKIEIGPLIAMSARDTLLIASDGLFDNLRTEEIAGMIRIGNLVDQTQKLVELAIRRMNGTPSNRDNATSVPSKPDDVTVVCYRQK